MSSAGAATQARENEPPESFGPSSAGARSLSPGDRFFRRLTQGFAILVLLSVVGILVTLLSGSWPALKTFGLGFLASKEWNPVTGQFGALAPLYGTVITSVIALLVGVPVSFGIALVITELAPRWLKRPIGVAIELLAAIPSIIYGMWGLFVFAPVFAAHLQPWLTEHVGSWPILGLLFEGPPMGIGMLTAGLILAIMIIPFMAAVMRDVFETVPASLRESAYALGCTTWEVVWRVILPYTRVGVIGGIMLGLGRALGETMAVTMVIGNSYKLTASLFSPGSTIASTIASQFSEASAGVSVGSLIYLALILFGVTLLVNIVARTLVWRMTSMKAAKK